MNVHAKGWSPQPGGIQTAGEARWWLTTAKFKPGPVGPSARLLSKAMSSTIAGRSFDFGVLDASDIGKLVNHFQIAPESAARQPSGDFVGIVGLATRDTITPALLAAEAGPDGLIVSVGLFAPFIHPNGYPVMAPTVFKSFLPTDPDFPNWRLSEHEARIVELTMVAMRLPSDCRAIVTRVEAGAGPAYWQVEAGPILASLPAARGKALD